MANTFSALKRVRMTERKTDVNRQRKSRMRHALRAIRRIMDKKDGASAKTMLPGAFSAVDRAAKNGVIKKNAAARYKSRLALRLSKLAA